MLGIKMIQNIPVHYQEGEHITEGLPPTPNIQPTPAPPLLKLLILFLIFISDAPLPTQISRYYAETRADNSGYTNHRVTCLGVMGSTFDSEQAC
jgi:hypothetical protein